MGGDHHNKPPYIVPDWRIYKVKDAPELLQVEEELAKHGLKNPWIRNHVWRYNKKYFYKSNYNGLAHVLLRGMPYGLVVALIAAGYEKGWIPGIGGDNNGGHGTDTGHH